MTSHNHSMKHFNPRMPFGGCRACEELQRVPVSTLANLGASFTEETIEVWCPWAEADAFTNFDGTLHFCQFCGATDHEPLPPASHVSETSSAVQ